MESLDCLFEQIRTQSEENETLDDFYQHLLTFYESQKTKENKQKTIKKIADEFNSYNMVYYNKTSKIYFNYIDNNYLMLNEDNMLHIVYTFITNFKHQEQNQPIDLSLKTTIKQKIMKNIKENSIYETIPDADTIQSVLDVCVPTIFERKEYAKIFLLSIGSMLLKKQHEPKTLIFVRTHIKSFLNEINKYICTYFCNHNLFNCFKFKYTQDHVQTTTEDCRKLLLPCKANNTDMFHLNGQFYVNLICVCVYYSNRYDSVDNYLTSVIEDTTEVEKCVNYFQHNTKETVSKAFVDTYLINKPNECMEQNELLFLWKQHVDNEDLFVHVFTSYQDFLCSLYLHIGQPYDESSNNNKLMGYYSMEIPTIQLFREFWDANFTYCEDEFYFEISEILHLFHQAHKQKKTNLSEPTIKLILQLYYDSFSIVKGKLIHNLKCTFWNKQSIINEFISKEHIDITQNAHTLYKKYCTYETNLKIGKKYFTMYLDKLKSDVDTSSAP